MDSTTPIVLSVVVLLVLLATFVMWVMFRNLAFADGTCSARAGSVAAITSFRHRSR